MMARRSGKQLLARHFAPVGVGFDDLPDEMQLMIFRQQDAALDQLRPRERLRQLARLCRVNNMYRRYYQPRLDLIGTIIVPLLDSIRSVLLRIRHVHYTDRWALVPTLRHIYEMLEEAAEEEVNLGSILMPHGDYHYVELLVRYMDGVFITEGPDAILGHDYERTTEMAVAMYRMAPREIQERLEQHLDPTEITTFGRYADTDDPEALHNFTTRRSALSRFFYFRLDGALMRYVPASNNWVQVQVYYTRELTVV